MGTRRRPRTGFGGGEHIPTLRSARHARVALALGALTLLVSLAVVVAADAGSHSGLAWLGAGAAALALGVGMLAGSPGAVHVAVALLGAIFVLRQDTRLLLAAPYGAGLLLMDDLAIQAVELRALDRITVDVIRARTSAAFVAATVGACASAAAAFAVTAAPGRSVALTALGAVAAVIAFALIVRLARRRYGTDPADESSTGPPA